MIDNTTITTPPTLAVDMAGRPIDWLHWQDAVIHYVSGDIGWSVGDVMTTIHGGYGRNGHQTTIDLHPVIAITQASGERYMDYTPPLTNPGLFARDRHHCLYCGQKLPARALTRDHVAPRCRGGSDSWENCATACKACNARKADAPTPERAGMKLLAVPYAPNYAESLILANRRILADQMDFLSVYVRRRSAGTFAGQV